MSRAARKARNLVARVDRWVNGGRIRLGNPQPLAELNEWQAAFCTWQAERVGVPEAEMRGRLLQSLNAVRGGHGGPDFRAFARLSYALYMPFAADTPAEVADAYAFHRHLHFLRLLSYPLRAWPADSPVVAGLAGPEVRIIDFGCGLAQNSVSLARALRHGGRQVSVALADVSTLQLDFLGWFVPRDGFAAETRQCTEAAPFPDFAPADLVFAEEVLEHVHDPLHHVERLDRLVAPGGFFLGNLADHEAEFMHVSPKLAPARARLLALGYTEIETNHVYQKAGGNRAG